MFGFDPGTEAERRYREWYQVRYHRPQDDMTQPLDFKAAADFNTFFYKLTEAVANAWDADAATVEIHIDVENDAITIVDDGIGMSVKDMNEKYLRVGYRRREEDTLHGRLTAKGRPAMGRKGLGKLSLFSRK